jgi:3-deoxy-D-glycero-D-galacto-nononate 9-phosphate synthase
MDRLYDSPHSFGKTYGEHRAKLELNDEQHFELYLYAKEKGFEFVETLCAVGCLSMFRYFQPDKLKVASRDLTNLPLLSALAETEIPIILSTGMAGKKELDDALVTISKYHNNISILHCVSEYPTKPENANLNTITYLIKNYPQYTIGYSDHTIGISAPVAAVALGAKIIEKHITLDRRMKGTDQAGSLGPDGINRMVRDIRLLELSLGKEEIFIAPSTREAKNKLERSIAAKRLIRKGEVITLEDIHLLSPGDGFKWHEKNQVIGKTTGSDINKDEIIYPQMMVQ